MSTATRVSLAEANVVAAQLVGLLSLGCDRIAIAGSVRRRQPTVGDIELVAVPRVHTETMREGLFEDREVLVDELQVVIDLLLMDGTLMRHPTDPKRGPRYSKLVHVDSGLQVDLFSSRLETFGIIFVIRTGPEAFSRWLVTEAPHRGFHVQGGELHRGKLTCDLAVGTCERVPTPEEADVFRALHLYHQAPEDRR